MDIEDTLKDRGQKYGPFKEQAAISQSLKDIINGYQEVYGETREENSARTNRYNAMSSDKKEALDMIMHKIARILNGQADLHDSWHDIVGYAKLVADSLTPEEQK